MKYCECYCKNCLSSKGYDWVGCENCDTTYCKNCPYLPRPCGDEDEMNETIKMLIKTAKSKHFRGKPTNRKMFNYGTKYYDDTIPHIKEIPQNLKDYFHIPDIYDNCFVNVYKNNDLIGIHKDKTENMNTNYDIISVSIGIEKDEDDDFYIKLGKNIKLGWMEIDNKKIDIYNKVKLNIKYESPHRAKTKIKDDIFYRLNFTFRVSANTTSPQPKSI